MAELLNEEDRQRLLPDLGKRGWQAAEGLDGIRKVWKFRNFSQAWAFMSRVALAAEKADHHPNWLNRYNVVDITLTTHSVTGLSQLDLDLAEKIDTCAGEAEVISDHAAPILSLCQIRAINQP